MLTSDHPPHARDFVRWVLGPVFNKAAYQLPDRVRNEGTGSGISHVTGGLSIYAYFSQPVNHEIRAIFSGAMTTVSMGTGTRLVTGLNFDRCDTVIDVDGSFGTYLAQILEHYRSIKCGIVFDLPAVIKQTKNGEEFKLRMIPETKVKFIASDMFDSSTVPQAIGRT